MYIKIEDNRPHITSRLRSHILNIPPEARMSSGIVINGRRIKSLVFTTDIAIIRNCDADAVLAVYPFTPQQTISEALIQNSSIPVLCGVGGGTTQGMRTTMLAWDAESQGAMGVVVNAPMSNEDIRNICKVVDIPVVVTVLNEHTDIAARLDAGATILNVSAADRTPEVIRAIRKDFPNIPIIGTGGPTGESIRRTIEAGANAISYTPPSTKTLFSTMMDDYRTRED
ncbi:MAG: hydrolase [Oscillospiraceae bacterium]|nr:hydrolase [Oscillospiraceae bacterium]